MAEGIEIGLVRVGSRLMRGSASIRISAAAVWIVIALTTVLRFTAGASRPIWMDETWTAMAALQLGAFLPEKLGKLAWILACHKAST